MFCKSTAFFDQQKFNEYYTQLYYTSLDDNAFLTELQQRSPEEIAEKIGSIIDNLFRTLIIKVDHAPKHVENTISIALAIGKELGLSNCELSSLFIEALAHDIGKLHIPDRVLNKKGKLTATEKALIRRHAKYSRKIIEKIIFLKEIEAVDVGNHHAYHHIENIEQLPLNAKILIFADSYEAMTHRRIYTEQNTSLGRELSDNEAIAEIERNLTTQFDSFVYREGLLPWLEKGKPLLSHKELKTIGSKNLILRYYDGNLAQIKQAEEIKKIFKSIIDMLIVTVRETRTNKRGYPLDTMGYVAVNLAKALGLSPERQQQTFLLSTLGIVGNIFISELDNPSRNPKRDQKKKLVNRLKIIEKSEAVLRPLVIFEKTIPLIEYTFENYNGQNSPHGLKYNSIPLECRIAYTAICFAVIDYDIDKIVAQSGIYFDPKIVTELVKLAGGGILFPASNSFQKKPRFADNGYRD